MLGIFVVALHTSQCLVDCGGLAGCGCASGLHCADLAVETLDFFVSTVLASDVGSIEQSEFVAKEADDGEDASDSYANEDGPFVDVRGALEIIEEAPGVVEHNDECASGQAACQVLGERYGYVALPSGGQGLGLGFGGAGDAGVDHCWLIPWFR